jgi:hypothetical protein
MNLNDTPKTMLFTITEILADNQKLHFIKQREIGKLLRGKFI